VRGAQLRAAELGWAGCGGGTYPYSAGMRFLMSSTIVTVVGSDELVVGIVPGKFC
jgi:hypothetical protein